MPRLAHAALLIALLAAAALAAAGCGGDSDDDAAAPAPKSAQLATDANKVVAARADRFCDLITELNNEVNAQDTKAVQAKVEEQADLFDGISTDLGKLRPADDFAADITKTAKAYHEVAEITRRAARNTDGTKTEALTAEGDQAWQQVTDVETSLNERTDDQPGDRFEIELRTVATC